MNDFLNGLTLHQKLEWLRDVPYDELKFYLSPEELAQLERENTEYPELDVMTLSVAESILETDPDSYAADEARMLRAKALEG